MSESAADWITSRQKWLFWLVRQHEHVPDADVPDVVQDACIRLWQRWDTWEDRGRNRDPWAAHITINVARDWWRHQFASNRDIRRTESLEQKVWQPNFAMGNGVEGNGWLLDPAPGPETLLLLRLRLTSLWVQLTVVEREVALELAAGIPVKEQAAQHDTSIATVKSRAHRLRVHARLLSLA